MKTDDLLKQATPRPWKEVSTCYDKHGPTYMVNEGTERGNEAEANAELQKRAVNSFEAMREALKASDSLIEALQRQTDTNFDGEERRQIAHALALAEGEVESWS